MPDSTPVQRPPIERVAVLIPTYNERDNLPLIVERTRAAVPSADVVVLDDNSPDGTGDVADAMAAADPQVTITSGTVGTGDPVGAASEAPLPPAQDSLSDRDRRILELESRTFRYVGSKERAIREEIGLSKVAYYVRLNALLDDPAALRAAPSVVNRLRAQRTSEDGPDGAHGTHRVA